MGLIARMVAQWRRLRHVWSWRIRYWWLDTRSGAQAQVVLCAVAALVVVVQLIHLSLAALAPQPAEPEHAIIWWVAYLITMLIAAAVSYVLRPKVQQTQPDTPPGQTTEDGQAVVRYWGTHWVDDEFLLAWMITGRDAIKTKGGKK